MKTLIDKDGIEWHYDDDLFLGEENIKLFPCYFAEYFPATVDPNDDLISVCTCHMVGFRTKNNPGDVCKGDPRKCPMVDGRTSNFDPKLSELQESLDTSHRNHDRCNKDYVLMKRQLKKLNGVIDNLCSLVARAIDKITPNKITSDNYPDYEFARDLRRSLDAVTNAQNEVEA